MMHAIITTSANEQLNLAQGAGAPRLFERRAGAMLMPRLRKTGIKLASAKHLLFYSVGGHKARRKRARPPWAAPTQTVQRRRASR